MIAALGVLLVLAGVSILVIGLVRYFFPSSNKFVPDDLKKVFSITYGGYFLLAGLLLLAFS